MVLLSHQESPDAPADCFDYYGYTYLNVGTTASCVPLSSLFFCMLFLHAATMCRLLTLARLRSPHASTSTVLCDGSMGFTCLCQDIASPPAAPPAPPTAPISYLQVSERTGPHSTLWLWPSFRTAGLF